MRQENCPPSAAALMESTRAIGYSLPTAIADIVDNSIAAGASRVDINFFPGDDAYITIMDDGCGMSEDELFVAMQYGGKSPNDKRDAADLGRFGLGLKTASFSQCAVLTVVTKRQGKYFGRRWDLDYIKSVNTWGLQILSEMDMKRLPDIKNLLKLESGTLVVWQKLDRLQQGDNLKNVLSDKMNVVRSHLSLVFHRYMADKDTKIKRLKIFMNNDELQPSDPFLTHENTQRMDKTIIKMDKMDKSGIKVIPYMLPYPSKMKKSDIELLGATANLRSNQGFYVYRNKRLIVWGTWFRRMAKNKVSELARIQIDVPTELDDQWVLDIKKSSAQPPQSVYNRIDQIVNQMTVKSQRTWEHRGKRETDSKIEHIWHRLKTRDKSIIYEINSEHTLVKKIIEKHPDISKSLKTLLNMITATMPLNQMMLDFNSDSVIDTGTQITEDMIVTQLDGLLATVLPGQQRAMLHALRSIEPFNAYTELIDKYEVKL